MPVSSRSRSTRSVDSAPSSRRDSSATEHWPAELAFLAGVAFAILVGTVFAIPALRTRGVNLAVVTLGLGFAVQQVVFSNEYFTGDFGSVTTIGRIKVFGWDVSAAEHPDRYLVVCLGVFVDRRPHGRQPPSLRLGATAHRGAEQRARRRVARDQRLRRQALRLRASAPRSRRSPGSCSRSRTPPSSTAATTPFQSINTVGNAVAGGVGWVLGAVFGGNLAAGGFGLDPARLDRPRLVAHHDRRRHADPHRDPEPERDRERRAQRRARHRQAAPAPSPQASPANTSSTLHRAP